jgi:fimbrial chaperone protein
MGQAEATGFGIVPTQILLGPKSPSATMTLHSEDDRTLRFQFSVMAWAQNAQGVMQLSPTKDIVFFPQLFELEPAKARIVRIGTPSLNVAVEKTYRLFVKELPPLGKPEGGGAQVNILTNLSIPIFVQPAKPVADGRIDSFAAQKRRASFEIKNLGNIHFQIKEVKVTGLGEAQKKIFEQKQAGWYVLAAGVRDYEFELPPSICGRIKSLTVEAAMEHGSLTARFDLPPTACGE